MKPREMTGPGPSAAELETILTIGARVPDHGKLAPWRFIVFEGDARARAGDVIAKVFARKNPGAPAADIEVEKKRLTDAPLVIGVVSFTKPHPKVPPWEQELSAGASAMNIVTAATALGYGACWCGMYPIRHRVEKAQELLRVSSIPYAVIAVGLPDQEPEARGYFDETRVRYIK